MPVRHLRIPYQCSGMAVERNHVRVIGHHEDAVAGDANPTIDTAGSIADQPLCTRPLVMPDFTSAAGIQRIAFVGARDVHDTIDDHRRYLQTRRVWQTEDPLRY